MATLAHPPTWLSVKEAAEQLNVSDDTVRRLIASGTLDAVRLGPRLIRINAADLAALVHPVQGAA